MKRVSEASIDDVAAVIGRKKAEIVFNVLNSNKITTEINNENSDSTGAESISND